MATKKTTKAIAPTANKPKKAKNAKVEVQPVEETLESFYSPEVPEKFRNRVADLRVGNETTI